MPDEDDTADDTTADSTAPATGETPPAKTEVPPEVRAALRKANKEAETLRLELKQYRERDLTEAQKMEQRVTTAEARAAELELRAIRAEVAADKGLPRDLAARLIGTTPEELAEDADRLKALIAPPSTEDEAAPMGLDLGQRGGASRKPLSMNDLIRGQAGILKTR